MLAHQIQTARSQLKEFLVQNSVREGAFTLSSGATSSVYVDAKLTTCFPQAIPLVGQVFLDEIRRNGWDPSAVGGLTLGADPIAISIARESLHEWATPIRAFMVRKTAKEHGRQKFIEGIDDTEGRQVIVIDDVCTKGGSTGTAIERIREAGMHVLGAICLVDREQGAAQLLKDKYGVSLRGVFTLSELRAKTDNACSGSVLTSVGV